MKIPKILHNASRQYRHNNATQLSKFEELVSGFDKDETIKIVTGLQAEIEHLEFAIEMNRTYWKKEVDKQQAEIDSYQRTVKEEYTKREALEAEIDELKKENKRLLYAAREVIWDCIEEWKQL